jgi:hypothetical protein
MLLLTLGKVGTLSLSESMQQRIPVLSTDSELHQPGVVVDAGCPDANLVLGHAEQLWHLVAQPVATAIAE